MFKQLIERITGIDKLKEEIAAIQQAKATAVDEKLQAEAVKAHAIEEAQAAKDAAEIAKKSPKEQATLRGEPWVAVLDTHVNKENIRNGFFEIDWNEYFITQLRQEGYGADGDPEEEIVDRWFRDIVRNMLEEEGMDATRGAGYINVNPIAQGKSEVS